MLDRAKAKRAVKFISLLNLTNDYHGVPFNLLEWQHQIIWDVFGTLNERGLRKYRNVYLEAPKKQGKTALIGAINVLHLFDKEEPNGEIYSCASDREQASIIYHTTVEMIEQDKALMKRVKIVDSYKEITNTETGTKYKALSSESFSKHGYRPSIVLFDELHAQPSRELWDVMTKGAFLARRQPLLWVITTAGMDPNRVTIGWEIHEKAQIILQARESGDLSQDSPSWYPVIYGYNGEDIYNEENWKKANPSLGEHLRIEDLRVLADDAKLSPSDELTFRWLHLNQWVTTKLAGWLPLDLFDSTNGKWNRNDLLGRECYMGLDLSTTTDLSAICLLFPPQDGFDEWRVIWDCWIPEINMKERIRMDHVPYDKWVAAGWLSSTPGDMIDYTLIESRINECRKLYDVKELDADRSFAAMLLQRLEQDGMNVVDIPQTYASLTDPMNTIEILLRSKRMTHESNPVARWCFGNTSIAKNGNAQIKYVKERKGKHVDRTKRIDLITALVCAMARARFNDVGSLAAIMNDDWGM
jgi:phage terminase large subunit-like protein